LTHLVEKGVVTHRDKPFYLARCDPAWICLITGKFLRFADFNQASVQIANGKISAIFKQLGATGKISAIFTGDFKYYRVDVMSSANSSPAAEGRSPPPV
jgi:hypothetical protein